MVQYFSVHLSYIRFGPCSVFPEWTRRETSSISRDLQSLQNSGNQISIKNIYASFLNITFCFLWYSNSITSVERVSAQTIASFARREEKAWNWISRSQNRLWKESIYSLLAFSIWDLRFNLAGKVVKLKIIKIYTNNSKYKF